MNRFVAFKDAELQALLDGNAAQAQKELSMGLNVDQKTIFYRLHAMEKIRKLGRWVPHQPTENPGAGKCLYYDKGPTNEFTTNIWWDQKGVVYYELLNPNKSITVTAER